MGSIMKLSLLLISLSLLSKATVDAQCTTANLKFFQVPTGAKVENKPEWKVTVNNDCICTQSNIQVSCSGFQTAEKIDPAILTIGKDTCLLLKDDRLYGFHNVSFNYAWDTQYAFKPTSSLVSCS